MDLVAKPAQQSVHAVHVSYNRHAWHTLRCCIQFLALLHTNTEHYILVQSKVVHVFKSLLVLCAAPFAASKVLAATAQWMRTQTQSCETHIWTACHEQRHAQPAGCAWR